MRLILCAAALALPLMGAAQEREYRLEEVGAIDIPVEKSEGYLEARLLTGAVNERNDAAAAKEAAALSVAKAEEEAGRVAYQQALARHQAELAAIAARTAEIEAADATARADYEQKLAAHQRALDESRRAQAAYEAAMADHDACITGDRTRCHYPVEAH